MVKVERLGVTPLGQPIVEVRTYQAARAEHPLAVALEGKEGHWVLASISNDLARVNAREVDRVEYNAAESAWADRAAQAEAQIAAEREAAQVSREQARQAARVELLALGLSAATVELVIGRR